MYLFSICPYPWSSCLILKPTEDLPSHMKTLQFSSVAQFIPLLRPHESQALVVPASITIPSSPDCHVHRVQTPSSHLICSYFPLTQQHIGHLLMGSSSSVSYHFAFHCLGLAVHAPEGPASPLQWGYLQVRKHSQPFPVAVPCCPNEVRPLLSLPLWLTLPMLKVSNSGTALP